MMNSVLPEAFRLFRQAHEEARDDGCRRGLSFEDADRGAWERVETFFGAMSNPHAGNFCALLREQMIAAGISTKTTEAVLALNHMSFAYWGFAQALLPQARRVIH